VVSVDGKCVIENRLTNQLNQLEAIVIGRPSSQYFTCSMLTSENLVLRNFFLLFSL